MIPEKILEIKRKIAREWANDPVKRAEDIFRIRKSDGSLVDLKVPDSQKEILRKGILRKARKLKKQGLTYRRVVDKGRQIGFSIILAVEAIMIAQDYPNTFQYYIAVRGEQAESWLQKVEQIVRDAKHWPDELGGGPILTFTDKGLHNKMTKVINDCTIQGLTANPAGLRGDTAINVILDEFAWMITKKNQQDDTYSAIKYFLRQGGQLTAQSTPRVSNDLFWKFYEKGRKLGFEPFYKPVIENWKDLDLHSPLFVDFDNERRELLGQERLSDKDIGDYKVKLLNNPNKNYVYDTKLKGIRQDPIIIPYPWVSLVDLEIDREQDLEIFMQENLGVPVDERYKLIIGDWIYPNQIEFNPSEPFDYELNPGDNWPDRGDSYNSFYIGIDWASKQDLTAITILEKIGEDYYERYSDCLSGDYEVQHSTVCELIKQFKPVFVAIDYTSEKSMGDRLEKEFGSKIKKVVFSSTTKAHLATSLKNIARRNNYHVLNFTRNQQLMVKHMLKVEKKITDTTTKYSGKDVDKEGRDDGFWSKSLAAYDSGMPGDKKMVQTRMAFGTSKTKTMVGNQLNSRKKLRYEDIIKERDKKEKTVVAQDDDRLIKLKEDLSRGLIICNHKKKPIKSYECLCVDDNGEEITTCKHYNYHKRICEKYGFTLKEAKKLLTEAQK